MFICIVSQFLMGDGLNFSLKAIHWKGSKMNRTFQKTTIISENLNKNQGFQQKTPAETVPIG